MKLLFLTIITLLTILPQVACADDLTFKKIESGEITIANPFKPHLPEKMVEEESSQPIISPPLTPAHLTKPTAKETPIPIRPEPPRPIVRETPMPQIMISGIVWDTDRPQAIINGEVVTVGDTLMEVKILDIKKTGLKVLFNDKIAEIKP